MASLMPQPKIQFIDANGAPYSGGLLYTAETGTVAGPGQVSPKETYTDSTAAVANANPVVLDSAGRAAVWLSGFYSIALYTSAGVLVYTADNVSSMSSTSFGYDQWVAQDITLSFIGATQFSTPGNVLTTFPIGTRLKATVTAGTIYGTVTASATGGAPLATTVTVLWDSGALDAGLSAIYTGIITVDDNAEPIYPVLSTAANYVLTIDYINRTIEFTGAVTAALTVPSASGVPSGSWYKIKNIGTANVTITGTVNGITNAAIIPGGEATIYSNGTAWYGTIFPFTGPSDFMANLGITTSVASKALSAYLKTASGSDPTAYNPALLAFRSTTTTANAPILRPVTAQTSCTLSSGSSLGFAAAENGRIYVWAIDNAGTIELAFSRTADIFSEENLVSTVAEGGAGAAKSSLTMYATWARPTVACRLLGYIEVQSGAVAGEWDNAVSKVQIAGFGVPKTGDIVQIQTITMNYATSVTAGAWTPVPDLQRGIYLRSAMNKVLVIANLLLGAGAGDDVHWRITRNASAIGVGGAYGSRSPSSGNVTVAAAGTTQTSGMNYLDTPGSSSATYQVDVFLKTATGYINRSGTDGDGTEYPRGISTMTLMEIQS